jgi:hypothetical protein
LRYNLTFEVFALVKCIQVLQIFEIRKTADYSPGRVTQTLGIADCKLQLITAISYHGAFRSNRIE